MREMVDRGVHKRYLKMNVQDKEFGNALLYIQKRPEENDRNLLDLRDIFTEPQYREDLEAAVKMNNVRDEEGNIIIYKEKPLATKVEGVEKVRVRLRKNYLPAAVSRSIIGSPRAELE
jgi:hypothetical protein